MEENQDGSLDEMTPQPAPSRHAPRWLEAATVVVVALAVAAFGYVYRERVAVASLVAQNQQLNAHDQEVSATLGQMRTQLDAVTAKLDQMMAEAAPAGTTALRVPVNRSSPEDARLKQLQAKLDAQQKRLQETQREVASNRSDIEGKLGSTRNELNSSIAKNHDELVTLEKQGERNYYEFNLGKSNDFLHVGPLQISLRKADTKHETYDLMLLVDDFQLPKKKVDLYEPIWLHEGSDPQPVQVVVNKIGRNYVHGYVSAPKYKPSELASASAASSNTAATDSVTSH